jgi:imidazolonepropionase-like amidohydrolase
LQVQIAPVAALTLVLALSHKLLIKDRLTRAGRWAEKLKYNGQGVTGRTLGIVGLGGIGRELAALARAFDMAVVASDPAVEPAAAAANRWVRRRGRGSATGADVLLTGDGPSSKWCKTRRAHTTPTPGRGRRAGRGVLRLGRPAAAHADRRIGSRPRGGKSIRQGSQVAPARAQKTDQGLKARGGVILQ